MALFQKTAHGCAHHWRSSISTNWTAPEGTDGRHSVTAALEALSRRIADLTAIDEDELLVELRTGVPLWYAGLKRGVGEEKAARPAQPLGPTYPSASVALRRSLLRTVCGRLVATETSGRCADPDGGNSHSDQGRGQNRDLHGAVCSVLTRHLDIEAERVRITRVQLYEILDHNSKTKTANSVAAPSSGALSPTSERKGFLGTLSPRQKSRKEGGGSVTKKSDSGGIAPAKKGFSRSLDRKKAADLTAQVPKVPSALALG